MKRVAVAAAALVLTAAGPAQAQSPDRVYRIGNLAPTATSERSTRNLVLPELAKLGFVEGRNLVFDGRIGDPAALPRLIRELLAAKPDVILTGGGAAVIAASAATRTVPIVSFGADLVALGLAASLARPGGNVTGVTVPAVDLNAKRLQVLLEALPGRRRVAALFSSTASDSPASEREMRVVATSAGSELLAFPVATAADYPAAFAAMRAAGAQALVIQATSEFSNDIVILAALALEARLPTICHWASNARAGCLIGYGPNLTALRLRNTDQIARIFRGAAPGEIPIELPTRFEFAVNLKVAKALGVELPPTILVRADEVIE